MFQRHFNLKTGEWTPMSQVHPSTFEYLKPTEKQLEQMATVRNAFAMFAGVLDTMLPPGADKTFIFRQLRDLAMWSNVTITRHADGTPRTDHDEGGSDARSSPAGTGRT